MAQVPFTAMGTSPVGQSFMVQAVAQTNGHSRVGSFPTTPDTTGKQPAKLTTPEGVKQTIFLLRDFKNLLERVIQGSQKSIPVLPDEDCNIALATAAQHDIDKVKSTRPKVQDIATTHQELLLNYHTYLRGVLEELAKCNLDGELEQIEEMLKRRVLPKEASSTLSSSPSSSPVKNGSSKEPAELADPLNEAWEKIGSVAELNAELAALKTKFAFIVEECPDDEFAIEYRLNESILFLNRFGEFAVERSDQSEPAIKWQKDELAKVMKAVTEAFLKMKKEINETDFLPSNAQLPNCKLSDRVTKTAQEFAGNVLISEPVENFRRLSRAINRLKEIILIENRMYHLREAPDRQTLHNRRVRDLASLKAEVLAMDVGKTMDTIKELMDKAVKQSESIKIVFGHVSETMELFDAIIKAEGK